jgi:hypothetical protein
MSSAQLASNQNSALINVLDASPAKVNPHTYSLDKIYPFSSCQWVEHAPSNSNSVLGQSNTFDLLKYGILTQLVLEFSVSHSTNKSGSATNGAKCSLPALQLIDSIELVSSSRVIQRLTRFDLLAMCSDQNIGGQQAFMTGMAHKSTSGAVAELTFSATVPDSTACINVTFPLLGSSRTQLNTTFNEPARVVVNWSNQKIYSGGSTQELGTPAVSNVKITGRYINYNNEDDSALLNENYKDGTLSQLTYEYFDEVSTSAVTTPAADDTVFGNDGTEVEIKDTGVVSDIYVMLIPEGVDQILTGTGAVSPATMGTMGKPLALEEIEFVASGQTIFSGKTSMLQLYGRVDPSSGRFTHSGFSSNTNHSLGVGLENVYRIQLGQDSHKNFCSGGISMRELNAPKIRVKRKLTNPSAGGRPKARLHVVLRKHSVITTESSNGRVVSSLNN